MKNAMSVKAIVVDLDKTLLHTDKKLSLYTTNVLRECQKNSIKIMVATARPLRTTTPYCQMIDFDAMVVSNGARVIHGSHRIEYKICQKSAEHILNALMGHPSLRITLETGDCAYSNKQIDDYETILSDDLVGIAAREGVIKILVHLDSHDALALVRKELTEDVYYTIAHGYLLQIMDKSATKWNGIQAMLETCNCSPDETVYFGDDQDDIEPIKMCGIGIAVSNGIDEVKSVADYVAENNDADGVAKFIEQAILKSLQNSVLARK